MRDGYNQIVHSANYYHYFVFLNFWGYAKKILLLEVQSVLEVQ